MTLERSLDECRLAVRYFFNNQFDEARGADATMVSDPVDKRATLERSLFH